MPFRTLALREIATHLQERIADVRLEGNGELRICGIQRLNHAGPGDLALYYLPRYAQQLASTRATAVILPSEAVPPEHVSCIRTKSPYLAFAYALQHLWEYPPPPHGVQQGAYVHPTAEVHPRATVMPMAYVGAATRIAEGVQIHPGCVLMERCRVGRDSILHAGVILREETELGERVILHPGVTIGGDGFAYVRQKTGLVKVPQIGRVVLEDDVEIGANTNIDRATFGFTRVGRGSKLDSLIAVGHNCDIGEDVIAVGGTLFGGSSVVEDRVTLAGRVGLVGHVTVGADSLLYACTVVTRNIPAGSQLSGDPAQPHRKHLREQAALRQLPRLLERVRELEREVAALRNQQ